MRKDYKLIALDMDGTVLNEHKKIDEITQKAIRKALAAGREVVFCTGRAFVEMTEFLPVFPDMHYLCLESGSLIYDLRKQKPLHTISISADTVTAIRDCLAGKDVLAQIISEGQSLANGTLAKQLDRFHMGVYQELYDRTITPVDDVFACVLEGRRSAEKINIYHTTPKDREKTKAEFDALHLPVTMVYSEVTSLECTAPGVSKAAGLARLCDTLGITMDQVIMVGDADNDLEALKAAGLAVAMGNAKPSVIPFCDVQVADNNHHGCAEAIERYLLN